MGIVGMTVPTASNLRRYVLPNRNRNNVIRFHVTDEERDLIAEKMASAGIINREAYLRKMTLDGYIVRLDLSDVREMVRLLSNATNNINQVAKRANETRSIYEKDLHELQGSYLKLWEQVDRVLRMLANVQK